MSGSDLESRLRLLRISGPPGGLLERSRAYAETALGLRRHFRLAWGAAAAAAVLVVAVAGKAPARLPVRFRMPEIATGLAEIDPGLRQRYQLLAMAEPQVDVWQAIRSHARELDSLKGDCP